MTLSTEEYQERGAAFWKSTKKFDQDLTHALFGMQTEAAEVTDLFKKAWFAPDRAKDFDAATVEDELGDVLYYLTRVADLFQLSLEGIMEHNLNKLEKRYGRP